MNITTRWAKTGGVLAAMLALWGPTTLFALPIGTLPLEAMVLVNEYWIKHPSNRNGGGLDPGRAVYQMGNLALYRTFCAPGAVPPLTEAQCDAYRAHTLHWAARHAWQLPTTPPKREADDQAVGQVYIELCPFAACDLTAILGSIHGILAHDPAYVAYNWGWIDAFFMAAPVFSKLGDRFDDARYFDKMTALFQGTDPVHQGLSRALYDTAEHLWYRDPNFLPSQQLTQNGKKIFWARGNGWVLAGLARVLAHLPREYPDRGLFVTMFRDMAASVKARQRPDGFWNVSLGDPDDYAGPETSGTALFTYAIAWGINHGVLTEVAQSLPVVHKAWEALVRDAVQDNGKLGYVQRAANEPCDWMCPLNNDPFKKPCACNYYDEEYVREATNAYGTGSFLLAGSEVAQLPVLVQAEEAEKSGGGARVESNHRGYHGSGFVNFPPRGGFIEWTQVDGGQGGLATLSCRYALGTGSSRTARLVVNGTPQEITFVSTGAWTTWKQFKVDRSLNPGTNNTIRLETTGQDSGNIDELVIKAKTP